MGGKLINSIVGEVVLDKGTKIAIIVGLMGIGITVAFGIPALTSSADTQDTEIENNAESSMIINSPDAQIDESETRNNSPDISFENFNGTVNLNIGNDGISSDEINEWDVPDHTKPDDVSVKIPEEPKQIQPQDALIYKSFTDECISKENDLSKIEPNMILKKYGKLPYVSSNDSPFNQFIDDSEYFCLENFEDGSLTTDGVSKSGGYIKSTSNGANSVDADGDQHNLPDGNTNDGKALFSDGAIVFTFNEKVLKKLPNYVGIVATNAGVNAPVYINLTAYDSDNNVIGTTESVKFQYSTGTGTPKDDGFIGISSDTGISHVQVKSSYTWMHVDHFQYGLYYNP